MNEDKKQSRKLRKLKCALCGESFEREELTLKSGKKYCKKCLVIRQEQMNTKKSDWDLLFQYICNLYNIKVPTGMMFMQMKQYRQEYKYTDIGMYYTLKYYYEILENKLMDDVALGIIPYYYDKAKKYYNKIFDLEDISEDFENKESNIIVKTKIINKKLDIKKPLPLNIDWEGLDENN